jgi:predicted metal-dependent peptidase
MSNIEKLKKAKLAVIQKFPYFAQAIFALRIHKSKSVGTLGVDKYWNLYYDEEFTESITLTELSSILIHEILHLLRKHIERRKIVKADHLEWNICCDAEINDDLRKDNCALPEGVLYPEQFEWEEFKTAEFYFSNRNEKFFASVERLRNCKGARPGSGQCGSAASGEKMPWETESGGVSEAEGELVRKQVANAVKNYGNVSDSMARWADGILGPSKIDWRNELAYVFRKAYDNFKSGSSDYTFTRPSRRFRDQEVIYPSMYDSDPKVFIVVDTSGSIGDAELKCFLEEIQGIFINLGIRTVRVGGCDCEINSNLEISCVAQLYNNLRGGGGTDMGEAIRYLNKEKGGTDICVILTDGDTPWEENKPSFDVIIVSTVQRDDFPRYAKSIFLEVPNGRES